MTTCEFSLIKQPPAMIPIKSLIRTRGLLAVQEKRRGKASPSDHWLRFLFSLLFFSFWNLFLCLCGNLTVWHAVKIARSTQGYDYGNHTLQRLSCGTTVVTYHFFVFCGSDSTISYNPFYLFLFKFFFTNIKLISTASIWTFSLIPYTIYYLQIFIPYYSALQYGSLLFWD